MDEFTEKLIDDCVDGIKEAEVNIDNLQKEGGPTNTYEVGWAKGYKAALESILHELKVTT